MQPYIIALDVDEVLADLLTAWLNRYNLKYNDCLKPSDLNRWDMISQVKPECGEDIYSFLTPDIYKEVKAFPAAHWAVARLKTMGRVIYVTAGNPDAKIEWLRREGFLEPGPIAADEDFYACKDKSLIRADVLFDDYVENVEAFPGDAYLVSHYHNLTTPCSRPRLEGFGIARAPAAVSWLKYMKKHDIRPIESNTLSLEGTNASANP